MRVALFYVLLSYLLGSIPFGLIFSRLRGVDPRRIGSGNIGATNVMRAVGKFYGIITLFFDVLKGFLPVYVAHCIGLDEKIGATAGFASFLGHIFPITLKFKGGKGVATALGVFLALNSFATLIAVFIFIVVVAISKYVSLGSLIASLFFPFLLYLFNEHPYAVGMAILTSGLIFLRHTKNIERLLSGKESKIRL